MTPNFHVATILGGVAAGIIVMFLLVRTYLTRARGEGEELIAKTRQEVSTLQDATEEALEKALRDLERESNEELVAEKVELEAQEAAIDDRAQVMALREDDLAELTREVRANDRLAQEMREQARQTDKECQDTIAEGRLRLEELSNISSEDAIAQIVAEHVEKAEHKSQIRLRNVEEQAKEEATTEAERLMATVIDRYDGIGHLERVQNAIPVPDTRTLEALTRTDSPTLNAFKEEIDCELHCDESAQTVTVRGDDPLAREIARRVLRQVANRSIQSPDRIRSIAKQVKGEVDREVQNAGRKAIRLLGLRKVHPEIVSLIGRLKFRLSYSQNQLKHAIEVAHISGMLAEEMGVSVSDALRGGLLHDIGKAKTHDHEGSHAVLGAEVARRCGEEEIISNIIGSHHNDEPPASAVAHLVTAADAISGARPGARRESITQYISRIQEIQDIASRSRAVQRVDVMHAGREVRVIVAGEQRGEVEEDERNNNIVLKDEELHPLAEEIARELESEVTFAGQIRVTVIRESRSVSIAH